MRINLYLANVLGISRRAADREIESGNVRLGTKKAVLGDQVAEGDKVTYKGKPVIVTRTETTTIVLHKPYGYITSRKRDETEAPTVMELLPKELQHLKPIGRLDKESEGLLLLTDDGDLLYKSTHPKFKTEKEYLVEFETPLTDEDLVLWKRGIKLTDGIAKADRITRAPSGKGFLVLLHQGKNRQIRRMAGKVGNKVLKLTRMRVGDIELGTLKLGTYEKIKNSKK